MKVVFDTNVFIAEALGGETARRILASTVRASWRIYISQYILDEVESVSYAPGAQRLSAVLKPPKGPSVRLVRTYDAAAPGALGELALALSGKVGAPRFVSGARRRPRGVPSG